MSTKSKNQKKDNTGLLIMGIILLFTPLNFVGICLMIIYFSTKDDKTSQGMMKDIKKELNKVNGQLQNLEADINKENKENNNKNEFNNNEVIHQNKIDNNDDGPIKYY